MSLALSQLAPRSLACITLGAQWRSGDVQHEDSLYVDRFSVWRDGDLLPAAIARNLVGLHNGDRLSADAGSEELAQPRDKHLVWTLKPSAFDTKFSPLGTIHPRLGRFYPRGILHGAQGIVKEEWVPMRVLDTSEERLVVDLNHPMAGIDAHIELTLNAVLEGADDRGGRCAQSLDDLLRGPGLKSPLSDGQETDFYSDQAFKRQDDRDDAVFYQKPRMMQHLDGTALAHLNEVHAHLIPAGGKVLDLMASWDSHLQLVPDVELSVLGMNEAELAANNRAQQRLVQDLNQYPRLPYADASFDAVVCTASIEYLIQPHAVLQEALRVLRPGGVMILSFTDRWFPSKSIRIWGELHEFERVGLVLALLRAAGFADLHSLSKRGWPRPIDDPHAGATAHSDPLHVAWGYRS